MSDSLRQTIVAAAGLAFRERMHAASFKAAAIRAVRERRAALAKALPPNPAEDAA